MKREIFRSFNQAGFEIGYLGASGHDLAAGTFHMPESRMKENYEIVKEHGMLTARDGLLFRHDIQERYKIAKEANMEIIWDLCHFDVPPEPTEHAKNVASLIEKEFWICPVNEPSICPLFTHLNRDEATDMGIEMLRVLKDSSDKVKAITVDPINGQGDFQYHATDRLVETGLIDVIGINYYPHDCEEDLSSVIIRTWQRYNLPILISETSWHDGHHDQMRKFPEISSKYDWYSYVNTNCKNATQQGARVEGICWYPIIDTPAWNQPGTEERWPHGLIKSNMDVDPHLSMALKENLR